MRIGIGVDGSSSSRAAVELVAALDLGPDDRVTVISVAAPPPTLLGTLGSARALPFAGLLDLALEANDERAAMLATHAAGRLGEAGAAVETLVRRGRPVDVLSDVVQAERLDLLALGAHGTGALDVLKVGGVTGGSLDRMPTSILVARPPTRTPRRIILAVDGAPASSTAVERLRGVPLPVGLEVHVLVSVTPWTDTYRGLEAPDHVALVRAEQERAGEIARQVIARLEGTGWRTLPLIRYGDPVREILDAAVELDVDLIVTGTRSAGHGVMRDLGRVSRSVSRAAPCSVLVAGPPVEDVP